MSDTCRECDKPIAVNADLLRCDADCAGGEECDGCPICEAFCWRNYHMGCPTPIDWRARCEVAETELRSRRAADLTAEDAAFQRGRESVEHWKQYATPVLTAEEREALKSAQAILVREFESDEIMLGPEIVAETKRLALAALAKLLASGGAK